MPTVLEKPSTQQATTQDQKTYSHAAATSPNEEPALKLFTVADYYRMGEAGVFAPDESVELLEGGIYEVSPKNPKHTGTVRRAARLFAQELGGRVYLMTQDPARMSDTSEPEPDITLALPRADDYMDAHPTPEQILLVVEVSLTTLTYDRNIKGRIYAAAGIKQYLVLNLRERQLEDHRDPSAEGYGTKHTYTADESFNLVAFPEIEIKVGNLLPPE